jgi:hypothetical protein
LIVFRIILGMKCLECHKKVIRLLESLWILFIKLVRKNILKIVLQLDMYCHNHFLARSQKNIVFSNKHLISLNFMSNPFESIMLDKIAST